MNFTPAMSSAGVLEDATRCTLLSTLTIVQYNDYVAIAYTSFQAAVMILFVTECDCDGI